MSTTTPTPGYNCRITVRFTTDRNGRPIAHYMGRSSRWLPIAYNLACILAIQGQANVARRLR